MTTKKISLIQIVAMILSVVIGSGIINLPAVLAKSTHQEAWISSLLGGVATLILLNLGLSLNKKYPGEDILGISAKLLGPVMSRGVGLIFLLYYYLIASLTVRASVDFISTWILPTTPIESMIFLFLISSCFLTRQGIGSVARFSEITTLMLLPFFIVLIIPYTEWDFLNLLPLASHPITAYLEGTLSSTHSYLGFEIAFFVLPFVGASYKKARRACNATVLSIIFIYTLFTAVSILTFGSTYIEDQIYTAIKYVQLLEFPLIERMEFIIVFFWIFALFSTFSLLYYFGYVSLQFVAPIKDKLWIIPYSIPIYFLALYPQTVAQVSVYGETVSLISIGAITGSLLLLRLIAFFKR